MNKIRSTKTLLRILLLRVDELLSPAHPYKCKGLCDCVRQLGLMYIFSPTEVERILQCFYSHPPSYMKEPENNRYMLSTYWWIPGWTYPRKQYLKELILNC